MVDVDGIGSGGVPYDAPTTNERRGDRHGVSIQDVAWVLNNSGARLADRLVLIALANHTDEYHLAWLSVEGAARETCMSRRNVQRCLRSLADRGRIRSVAPGGMPPDSLRRYLSIEADRRPTAYAIILDAAADRGDNLSGGDKSYKEGATNPTKNVSSLSPESSVEPPTEPSTIPAAKKAAGRQRRTKAQIAEHNTAAHEITTSFFDWYAGRHDGHSAPYGFPATMKIVGWAIADGYERSAITRGLACVSATTRPITKSTLCDAIRSRGVDHGRSVARPTNDWVDDVTSMNIEYREGIPT